MNISFVRKRVGNLLAFLATEVSDLRLTKLLKLLYMIDEAAIRRYGVPVTWLEYKVWQFGPVASEIYHMVASDQQTDAPVEGRYILNYISVDKQPSEKEDKIEYYIRTDIKPDLSFFSESEEGVIREIVDKWKPASAKSLVKELHRQGSLWHNIVVREDLESYFESQQGASDFKIDFDELVKDNDFLSMVYHAACEAMEFEKAIYHSNNSVTC